MRGIAKAAGIGVLAGAGLAAYGYYESKQYQLRNVGVPILPAGSDPLLILQVSDLHMMPNQHDKVEWIQGLGALQPDLVVATGDFLSSAQSVAPVLDALGSLLDVPGLFVLGSNDYYSPKLGNPFSYLTKPSEYTRGRDPDLPWQELVTGLDSGGWIDLSNCRADLTVAGHKIAARGVDDPHIGRDDYAAVAGPFDSDALDLGVAHAPYLRVLDAMANDGADLIIAGHTHGGQVCVPGVGALTTNCDLDVSRAKGLHDHAGAKLHVSAGLGTNPYTPFRIACPPEATLLILTEKPSL